MGSNVVEQTGSRQFCSECGRPYAPEDLVRFGAAVVCAECKPGYVQRMREGALPGSGVRYAGFWRRFLAVFIDGIILDIVILPMTFMMGANVFYPQQMGGDNPLSNAGLAMWQSFWRWSTLFGFVLQFAYYVYFISQKGATLGKMVMGVKVITATGQPVSVPRAIGRFFAQQLSWLILCIGYIMAAFDDQKRALHDHICNTRVIRD